MKTGSRTGEKRILGFHRNVFSAGIVSFFMDFSSEMIYPLVPIFLSSVLGVNKSVIGLIEGIAESTASILKVFSGWLSDKLGRRKALMTAGYGISVLSRPVIALATLWGHVLTFRFIDRFGKGIRGAPRDALIAESTHHSDLGRSFGFHRGMDTLGAVFGPLTAYIILSLYSGNYRLVFWLSMIPGMIAVMVILFYIREKGRSVKKAERHEGKEAGREASNSHLFDWRYKAFVGVATLFTVGNSSDVFLILRANNIGVAEAQIPLLYLLFNLVYSLIAMPAGIVADRFGRKRVILSGFVLFSFVYWGFAAADEIWQIWGLFILYGVFMGLTEGIHKAYLGSIIPEGRKAMGYGIFSTFTGLAVLPASVIGGYLWDTFGASATFYYGTIISFASALLFLIISGIERMRSG